MAAALIFTILAILLVLSAVCSEGCTCLSEENAKKLGYTYCQKEEIVCGYDQLKNPMYCYQPPVTSNSKELTYHIRATAPGVVSFFSHNGCGRVRKCL